MADTFTPDYNRLQRMQDDAIVSRYMAEIDTRIDKIVLDWRRESAWVDLATKAQTLLHTLHRQYKAAWEHDDRPADLQQLIEEIRSSAEYIEAERHADIGFGPYDHNDDKYLAMVLDYAGNDFADEETGSTEWDHYVMRFGRVILLTDDQGFRTLLIETEERAKEIFKQADDQYSEWASANED